VTHYFTDPGPAGDATFEFDVELAGRRLHIRSAPGVFSSHRVDLGTSVLLRTCARQGADLPACGRLLDLGCGWGPLALALAILAPGCEVWAVDSNLRALELTDFNARANGLDNVHVAQGEQAQGKAWDVIWSNPPIRIGKPALHQLLDDYLGTLAPGGHADLTVQRNLGADSLARWLDEHPQLTTTRLASAKGYRVLRATRN
jgi:16S rRNA G1207 methylase RsmC